MIFTPESCGGPVKHHSRSLRTSLVALTSIQHHFHAESCNCSVKLRSRSLRASFATLNYIQHYPHAGDLWRPNQTSFKIFESFPRSLDLHSTHLHAENCNCSMKLHSRSLKASFAAFSKISPSGSGSTGTLTEPMTACVPPFFKVHCLMVFGIFPAFGCS